MKGYDKMSKLSFRVFIDGIADILFVKSLVFEQPTGFYWNSGGPIYDAGKIILEFYEYDDLKYFLDWADILKNVMLNPHWNSIPGIRYGSRKNCKREGSIRYYGKFNRCVKVIALHGILLLETDIAEHKVTLTYDYSFIQVNP